MDNREIKIITKRIKAFGIVQGVGFRPLVYRMAKKLGVKGFVRNVGGYVEIAVQSGAEQLEEFCMELSNLHSVGVEIIKIEAEEITQEQALSNLPTHFWSKLGEEEVWKDFIIVESKSSEEVPILPPDLPICPKCQEELFDEDNRRYHNPFISCMSCGPRYTIMEEVPYDRHTTTMVDFPMCPSCYEEYKSPDSRRFHAQTISCNECGPYLLLREYSSIHGKNHSESKQEKLNLSASRQDKLNISVFGKDELICNKLNRGEDSQGELNQSNVNQSDINKAEWNDKGILSLEKNSANKGDETLGLKMASSSIKKFTNRYSENEEALVRAVSILKDGGIVAVKGIGGYHLVCSPFIEETVVNLRRLKGREEKPFAVMFPDLGELEEYCRIGEEEKALLLSNARPIVLSYMEKDRMAPSTNKGSMYCGAFLPYTPLQLLLTKECGPLIMTSANLSNQPIIKDDDKMCSLWSPYLKGVLYNSRRIVRTVDDSVAKIIDGKPQLIRRSRGFVPYPVFLSEKENTDSKEGNGLSDENWAKLEFQLDQKTNIKTEEKIEQNKDQKSDQKIEQKLKQIRQEKEEPILMKHGIFSAGGDLKAAFCLYKDGRAVVSQYIGDLEESSVMKEYQRAYGDLKELLKINPGFGVCDMHPNYHSARFVKSLGLPFLEVQHHHAHIASVMAEHDLHNRVIGIAFDGTGYGTDGNIWGGEFLVCEGKDFRRAAHLSYTPMIGGDQSMKDAKKTASCYMINGGLSEYVEDERGNMIKAALDNKINTILSSSMGRLFDAVASILHIAQENRYEGECAALLEKEAVFAIRDKIVATALAFGVIERDNRIELDPIPVLKGILENKNNDGVRALALGFHYALSNAIESICILLREKYQTSDVALSGGVFQNSVLTEQTLCVLREKGFHVYTNLSVPPNDGAISLGQTYIAKEYLEQR